MEKSSFIERLLQRPFLIYAILGLFIIFGVMGYSKMDRKLFPESDYPVVATVIVQPGASAKTLASNVAVAVEKELYTIDKIRRVYSTTIDEVTVISAEFEYSKDLSTGASDVSNALDKIRSILPPDIKEPQIHKISAATPPVVVIGVSSDHLPMIDLRQLAETKVRDAILLADGVANVEVFGGYKKEVQIVLDKGKLDEHGLGLNEVMATLKSNDKDYAVGFVSNTKEHFLLRSPGKEETIQHLRSLSLNPSVNLGDVSKIYFGHYENSAAYYANGYQGIALSVQRGSEDDVLGTIDNVMAKVEKVKKQYPNLRMEVTDTQGETISLSIDNMFDSLSDAIIMSTIVVFIFLASFRQVFIVVVTIPIVYLATIALMWLFGLELNIITLTGIILALGLLLDDTVVVMENIERHYKEGGGDIDASVIRGTKEILFADLSGTVTTMLALFPILFVGGFPQTMFQPLVGTLLLALTASYFVSITLVPLLSLKVLVIEWPWLIRAEKIFARFSDAMAEEIQSFFASSVKLALSNKIVLVSFFAGLFLLFVMSAKLIMPVVGQELMPPMDTGAIKVSITVDPNLPIEESQKIVTQVNTILKENGPLLYMSSQIGSEPGIMSIGSGSGIDSIRIVATYINRLEREDTIYEINRRLRPLIAKVENIKSVEVVDTGSSVLKSIRAAIDVTLYSDSIDELEAVADKVEEAMYKTQGLISVMRTWYSDKTVYDLEINQARASFHGLNSREITKQLEGVIRGGIVSSFPLQNSIDLGVRVWLPKEQRNAMEILQVTLLDTPKGKIPLNAVASFSKVKEPTSITREGLKYTLNVYGSRETASISHIMASFNKAFEGVELPASVTMEQSGDIKQSKIAGERMGAGIGMAILFIFFSLIAMFNSLKVAIMVTLSIPMIIIGAAWGNLIMNYHTSMPAMMGLILLSGIIVNNAILLLHFAMEQMEAGMNKTEAMIESIRLRTRPVVMTTFAVSVGMLPVAMGSAIGLERLAPLGAVAIGGLMVGTFLTLLFIPIIFILITKDKKEEPAS